MPVPPSLARNRVLGDLFAQPHLQMTARPGAVPCARHYSRQLLWDLGLKELIDPVELVVSELVTNAIRASQDLDARTDHAEPVIGLWVIAEDNEVLVLVSDVSSARPQRKELTPDAESGRGLLLVETLSVAWGSFELVGKPGKVVWALCNG